MANEGRHEALDELSDKTRNVCRAVVSLTEELEAHENPCRINNCYQQADNRLGTQEQGISR